MRTPLHPKAVITLVTALVTDNSVTNYKPILWPKKLETDLATEISVAKTVTKLVTFYILATYLATEILVAI